LNGIVHLIQYRFNRIKHIFNEFFNGKKKYLQLNSFFGMKSNTFELDIEWIEIQFNMIDIQDVI